MDALYGIAGFGFFGIVLILFLRLLTEKAEVQILTGIVSMSVGYLMINLLSINNLFTGSLLLGGLLVVISGIKLIR